MAAVALENPTSNLQRASRLATQQLADTLLEHYDSTIWTRWTRWPLRGGRGGDRSLRPNCQLMFFDDPWLGRPTRSHQTKRDKTNCSVSRHDTARGTSCMQRIRFALTRPLASVLFTQKRKRCAFKSSAQWAQCSCIHQEMIVVSIVHRSFQTSFRTCRCRGRCEAAETPHRVDARKLLARGLVYRTKSMSKSHLSDVCLTFGSKQGPLDVGPDLPDVLMDEIDAECDTADKHFDGRAAENSTVADEIQAINGGVQAVCHGSAERQSQRNVRSSQPRLVH